MSLSTLIYPNFYWVGVQDPDLRVFDIIMETAYGTTYNAYLLRGSQKTAVFETVKDRFADTYLNNIQAHIDPSMIDYIIVNHTEPDHTGALMKLLQLAPHATVVGSSLAIKFLNNILNHPFQSLVVKEGDTLSLGNKTIHFLSVPFLHWPDTMFSYIEEDCTLVTCDVFGAHYTSSVYFHDKLSALEQKNYFLAFEYYYNMIMSPFKSYMLKALEKVNNLETHLICPSHGLMLKKESIALFKNYYTAWSTPTPCSVYSIVIPYVSAYGYTKELAYHIRNGIADVLPDSTIALYDLSYDLLETVEHAIKCCDALVVGSPTLLGDTLPQIWQLLTTLNPLIDGGKYAACFGTYGWSPEATKNISTRFKQLKFKTPLEPFTVCFKPSEQDLLEAHQFGMQFANALHLT